MSKLNVDNFVVKRKQQENPTHAKAVLTNRGSELYYVALSPPGGVRGRSYDGSLTCFLVSKIHLVTVGLF